MDELGLFLQEEALDTLLDRKFNQDTGEVFAPWSPTYKRMGAPFHGGHELLFLTGVMAGSVDREVVSDDEVHVGAAEPAQFHVKGTPIMPARDFLSVGQNQEDELCEIAARQLERELAGAA